MSNFYRTVCSHAQFVFALALPLLGSITQGLGQAPGASNSISVAWSIQQQPGRLILKERDQPIAVFHYQNDQCLRPFFSDATTVTGLRATRNFPPVSGVDPDDHASMHGGIWLAFGDINGEDFWRNKGRIEHQRFLKSPTASANGIAFTSDDALIDSKGTTIGTIEQSYSLSRIDLGYCLVWNAIIKAGAKPLILGDQEEMGLGVRVATNMTEKNGGQILSSDGKTTAKATWGKMAAWVDYSKTTDTKRIGVVLMPDPANFKPSWFHNRDYGLMVANSFGNKSFTQGEPSAIVIDANGSLKLKYAIYWYEASANEPRPIERISNEMAR
ncbi:MAG: DUF6807 family protein [Pirellula sp.]